MSRSQFDGFGVMIARLQRGLEEVAVGRRFACAMILLAALAPPAAHAQVNIDQGKAPAQIYDSDCAACHKSIRGLANGRAAPALTSFLTEHYTSSSKEAAALAAYVLSGGGGVGTPAPTHAPKLKPEPTTASAEEPKDRDVKRLAKPEGDQGAAPKSQRPSGAGQKPDAINQKPDATQAATGAAGSAALPDRKPAPGSGRTGTPAGTVTRVGSQAKPVDGAAAAPKPAPVAAAPSVPEGLGPGASPVVPESAEVRPSAEVPVPRDNIPD
jgi:mono/diheme cytochrome c family protein